MSISMSKTGSPMLVSHSKNENIPDLYEGSIPAFICCNTWQVAMGHVFCSVSLALFEVKGEHFALKAKDFSLPSVLSLT